ncbi:cis-prenyltransferase [Puccinia graminis f. sp. tritici]|uniref:Cis-prenyltransferase n=1 Tax=Puccinia graminis f. sp. tritici TaxID=56615 RepID=A0A5B0SM47_PUCGR|nr:cis-prenyltransferase [Puccinia graminis f. sp. tritici]
MMNLSQFATNSTLQRFRKKLVDLTPVALYPIVRTLTIEALKLGPIPKHISFIMDGNRRYSREQGISIQQGHFRGFLSLKRLLEFLLRLGVSHITVYAFAIDNYRRTAEEIEKLMDMGKSKMLEICERGELFERFGIRVRMVGRVDLLPPDVLLGSGTRKARSTICALHNGLVFASLNMLTAGMIVFFF